MRAPHRASRARTSALAAPGCTTTLLIERRLEPLHARWSSEEGDDGWTSGACHVLAGRRALVAHLDWTSGVSSARGGRSMIAAPRDGGRPAVARWCCWMCRSRAKTTGHRGATLRAAVRRAWRDVARLPHANFVVAAAASVKLRRCRDG
ncbi:7-deoxyloganetin glucosyltransferase-like [Dorcoceras hygrometricum]|uniref:7-deoxyloganetin glucosyltransferase-like n=1 Tax=Dorcoceras hygrometricum TaxID=472368 RepID=A0A2Z6ZYY8_9LAMI|nr:7-deoxyloganetin glucosyltransferase-like [Dorcoceras hygrometricum]